MASSFNDTSVQARKTLRALYSDPDERRKVQPDETKSVTVSGRLMDWSFLGHLDPNKPMPISYSDALDYIAAYFKSGANGLSDSEVEILHSKAKEIVRIRRESLDKHKNDPSKAEGDTIVRHEWALSKWQVVMESIQKENQKRGEGLQTTVVKKEKSSTEACAEKIPVGCRTPVKPPHIHLPTVGNLSRSEPPTTGRIQDEGFIQNLSQNETEEMGSVEQGSPSSNNDGPKTVDPIRVKTAEEKKLEKMKRREKRQQTYGKVYDNLNQHLKKCPNEFKDEISKIFEESLGPRESFSQSYTSFTTSLKSLLTRIQDQQKIVSNLKIKGIELTKQYEELADDEPTVIQLLFDLFISSMGYSPENTGFKLEQDIFIGAEIFLSYTSNIQPIVSDQNVLEEIRTRFRKAVKTYIESRQADLEQADESAMTLINDDEKWKEGVRYVRSCLSLLKLSKRISKEFIAKKMKQVTEVKMEGLNSKILESWMCKTVNLLQRYISETSA